MESWLSIIKENSMDFKYILKEEEELLSLNRADISLIQVLKRYIWYLNMTFASIGSNFLKINPLDFDNFRISNE